MNYYEQFLVQLYNVKNGLSHYFDSIHSIQKKKN